MTEARTRHPLIRLAAVALLLSAPFVGAKAQGSSFAGRLVVAAHDPAPGFGPAWYSYHLIAANGTSTDLQIDEAVIARAGGVARLRGRTVSVTGTRSVIRTAPGAIPGLTRGAAQDAPHDGVRVQAISVQPSIVTPASSIVTGAVPFATLLCRFSDRAGDTPAPPSVFATWMGASAPGANNFWTETSAGNMTLSGSQVYGWFDMTGSFDNYYGPSWSSRYASGLARDMALRDDCANVADATVNFANFSGVTIQTNADMPASYAYLSGLVMTRDGVSRAFATVVMARWAGLISGPGVYAHEIGHTLGLEHSSGPYGNPYDSRWDVMSNSYVNFDAATGGYFGAHTIAYNKFLLGWIPSNQRVRIDAGAVTTVIIERSAQPVGTNKLYVEVPILGSPGNMYTIEARSRIGVYEAGLPGEGIVIHRINPSHFNGQQLAQVVDIDQNGDPNDATAVWTVGETFSDPFSGVKMQVVEQSSTGYRVVVTPGHMLTVQFEGQGSGQVLSDAGVSWSIACTSTASVSSGACARPYYPVEIVTLRATAAPGSRHAGWTGACTGTSGSLCKVLMNQTASVTATFDPVGTIATQLAIVTQPGNALSGLPFAVQPVVQLKDIFNQPFAQADVPVSAVVQSGSGVLSGTTTVLTNASGTATFTDLSITGVGAHVLRFRSGVIDGVNSTSLNVLAKALPVLTVTGSGSGTVQSIPAGVNCTLAAGVAAGNCANGFAEGAAVTLAPTPATGFTFSSWSGACSGSAACVVTMDQSRSVNATFTPLHFIIAATPTPTNGGTVTGAGSYAFGEFATLIAKPVSGWRFVEWTENGVSGGAETAISVAVTGNRTWVAKFTPILFPLTLNGAGSGRIASQPVGLDCTLLNGTASGTCSFVFASGTSVVLTPTPASGFVMSGWSGACSGGQGCTVLVDEPRSVSIAFAPIVMNVFVSLSGDGDGRVVDLANGIDCTRHNSTTSGRCASSVKEGDKMNLTATTTEGTLFVGWDGACTGFDVCRTLVGSNVGVTAAFVVVPTISPSAAALELLGSSALSSLQRLALDRWGNNDGVYDVGDLLAHLDRTQQHLSPAMMQNLLALPPSTGTPVTRRPPGAKP